MSEIEKGMKVRITTQDNDNGKIGSVTAVRCDGFSVYIEGDEDDKFFEESELIRMSPTQDELDWAAHQKLMRDMDRADSDY